MQFCSKEDIKDYIETRKADIKKSVQKNTSMGFDVPTLAIIQVGNLEASNRYIKNKIKDCEEVGIIAEQYGFDNDITEVELVEEIKAIAEFTDGIIVQLPLPPHIRSSIATAAIPAEKDVDGFRADSPYAPATPGGIMKYLRACEFDLTGKDVVIIGRSNIVGKPLAAMMTAADATVTLCHSIICIMLT